MSDLTPLPTLAEQHRVVAKIDELMAICDRLPSPLAAKPAVGCGNPGGSLESTRRSFNKDFLLALAADFKKHGAEAIERRIVFFVSHLGEKRERGSVEPVSIARRTSILRRSNYRLIA